MQPQKKHRASRGEVPLSRKVLPLQHFRAKKAISSEFPGLEAKLRSKSPSEISNRLTPLDRRRDSSSSAAGEESKRKPCINEMSRVIKKFKSSGKIHHLELTSNMNLLSLSADLDGRWKILMDKIKKLRKLDQSIVLGKGHFRKEDLVVLFDEGVMTLFERMSVVFENYAEDFQKYKGKVFYFDENIVQCFVFLWQIVYEKACSHLPEVFSQFFEIDKSGGTGDIGILSNLATDITNIKILNKFLIFLRLINYKKMIFSHEYISMIFFSIKQTLAQLEPQLLKKNIDILSNSNKQELILALYNEIFHALRSMAEFQEINVSATKERFLSILEMFKNTLTLVYESPLERLFNYCFQLEDQCNYAQNKYTNKMLSENRISFFTFEGNENRPLVCTLKQTLIYLCYKILKNLFKIKNSLNLQEFDDSIACIYFHFLRKNGKILCSSLKSMSRSFDSMIKDVERSSSGGNLQVENIIKLEGVMNECNFLFKSIALFISKYKFEGFERIRQYKLQKKITDIVFAHYRISLLHKLYKMPVRPRELKNIISDKNNHFSILLDVKNSYPFVLKMLRVWIE
jgi:hypothetical protein